jgi:hypothetical protein
VTKGLVLKLSANETYDGKGKWKNLVSGSGVADATVPAEVTYDANEKAFRVDWSDHMIKVPNFKTNPHFMPASTWSLWVKPLEHDRYGWVLAQMPDWGWSRAFTLFDPRLGGVSMTAGKSWNAGHGKATYNKWVHIVGRWKSTGECDVWRDGQQGKVENGCSNGRRNDNREYLAIGGRHRRDRGHNVNNLVSDVSIFDRALDDEEIKKLWNAGIRPAVAYSMKGDSQPASPIKFIAEVESPSEFANSFWVHVDDDASSKSLWQTGIHKTWARSPVSPTFNVKPGKHTLTITGREDGMKIRNVIMKGGLGCSWV